ncbi:MAG TPA: DUF1761 domain-containing protein [Candidatus Dormibacteraeota bacterium]|nr:DUF1761 domain-containing protein [Candidatus Dormibacteraeota bacterium]
MSFDLLGQLNWLAVIVGAVIYFALGALWYSNVLFAKPWQKSIGWDPTQQPEPQQNPLTYVVPGLAYLVMAVATGMIAKATGSGTLGDGIVLGLILGVGYGLATSLVNAFFTPNSPQPMVTFAITGTYNLIGFVIMAVIVSVWV